MSDIKHQTERMKKIMEGSEMTNGEDQALMIQTFQFHSDRQVHLPENGTFDGNLFYHELVDRKVQENVDFTYPVILPRKNENYNRAILLMHGLNERTWDKYLAWGAELAQKINCPVILFPIAYHMNRSPKVWSNPRQLKDVVDSRNKVYPENETTFANAALSTRLSAHPEQFVYSGVQSFYDVWHLAEQIRQGKHPLFALNTQLDFFAYSIGAFLTEILFIANPGRLFTQSKLFIFAGGPTFDRMQGTSRYIMDLSAFKSLLSIKRRRVLKKIYKHLESLDLPDFENTWRGFFGMLHHRKGRKIREKWLAERGDLVHVVALKNDQVMPVSAIQKTVVPKKKNNRIRLDVIDFPFAYTHENPFPVNDEKNLSLVNRSFDVVFGKAVQFYLHPEKKLPEAESLPVHSGMRFSMV